MRKHKFIYALADPVTKEIRYIGCSQQPKKRFTSHYCNDLAQKRDNPLKSQWVESLKRRWLKPLLIILERASEESAKESESKWIAFYFGKVRLTNIRTPEGKPIRPEPYRVNEINHNQRSTK